MMRSFRILAVVLSSAVLLAGAQPLDDGAGAQPLDDGAGAQPLDDGAGATNPGIDDIFPGAEEESQAFTEVPEVSASEPLPRVENFGLRDNIDHTIEAADELNIENLDWDLESILPRLGNSVKEVYEENKALVNKGVSMLKEAGSDIIEVGLETAAATTRLGFIFPKLVDDLADSRKLYPNTNRDILNNANKKLQAAVRLFNDAGEEVTKAGVEVSRIATATGKMIPRYTANILSESDRANLKIKINTNIAELKMSVRKSNNLVRAGTDMLARAFREATDTGHFLSMAAPELGSDKVYYKNLDDEVQETYKQIQDSLKEAMEMLESAGEKLHLAGNKIFSGTKILRRSVYNFAYGLVLKKKDVFERNILSSFQEQVQSLADDIMVIKQSGHKFIEASMFYQVNVRKLGMAVPRIGMKIWEDILEARRRI